jgi:hypothetical protein
MRPIIRVARRRWRSLVALCVVALLAVNILDVQLGSLTGRHLSQAEQMYRASFQSLSLIGRQPFNEPLRLLGWLTTKLPFSVAVQTRLPSVICGIISLYGLIYIIRRWYGRRLTVLSIPLLLTASWFLHINRYGGIDASYFVDIVLLLMSNLLLHHYADRRPRSASIIWLLVAAFSLTIPGMLWFVILNTVFNRREIQKILTNASVTRRITLSTVSIIAVGGLGYHYCRSVSQLLTWIGLHNYPHSLHALGEQASTIATFVWYERPLAADQWLGKLPLLDVFMTVMLLTGCIFYARHWRARRTHLITAYGALSILLILCGRLTFSLLIPIIFLIAVGGIGLLLHQWLRVFPRNPLARTTGITLLTIVVLVSCLYNVREYFIAWPDNPSMQAAYAITATTPR